MAITDLRVDGDWSPFSDDPDARTKRCCSLFLLLSPSVRMLRRRARRGGGRRRRVVAGRRDRRHDRVVRASAMAEPASPAVPARIYIKNLIVAEGARRRGLASRLMHSAERAAEGSEHRASGIPRGRHRQHGRQALYAKLGYEAAPAAHFAGGARRRAWWIGLAHTLKLIPAPRPLLLRKRLAPAAAREDQQLAADEMLGPPSDPIWFGPSKAERNAQNAFKRVGTVVPARPWRSRCDARVCPEPSRAHAGSGRGPKSRLAKGWRRASPAAEFKSDKAANRCGIAAAYTRLPVPGGREPHPHARAVGAGHQAKTNHAGACSTRAVALSLTAVAAASSRRARGRRRFRHLGLARARRGLQNACDYLPSSGAMGTQHNGAEPPSLSRRARARAPSTASGTHRRAQAPRTRRLRARKCQKSTHVVGRLDVVVILAAGRTWRVEDE